MNRLTLHMHPFPKRSLLQRTLTAWLAIVLAFTQTGFSPALAQTVPDIESPIIELEAILEADAGKTQVFTALVADDRLLKDVTLYHRREGRQAFDRTDMLPMGTTGYYSIALPTDPSDLRTIEYYVQARDQGGNRSISGYAFDPYQRKINVAQLVAEPATSPEPTTQATVTSVDVTPQDKPLLSKKKWWSIAIAVLVVGTIAASSSGGSSSADGEPARTGLTINLPLPQ